jgi:hypothetical protein
MNVSETLETFRSGDEHASSEEVIVASPEGLEQPEGGYIMSSIPVAPAELAISPNRISRHRVLPGKEDRCFVPISLNRAADVNLELFCVLTGQTKNGLIKEILTRFLSRSSSSCNIAHEQKSPSEPKSRVTFVISKDLQKELESFARRNHCHQACAVTAALIKFLKANGINPYFDPSEGLLRQLQSAQRRKYNSKSRTPNKPRTVAALVGK